MQQARPGRQRPGGERARKAVGLFKTIKALYLQAEPVVATARVLRVEPAAQTSRDDLVLDLELRIVGDGREDYVIATSVAVPPRHVAEVVPGAELPVRVNPSDPASLVVAWDD
jgi:hypothetical protein